MDFAVSEKMQVVLELINEFVDKELIPLEPQYLSRPWEELEPVLEDKRRMVKQMELWAPLHPKEWGGMGLDLVEYGLVCEALARTFTGVYVFGCQAPDAGNIEILMKYGTPEQKEKFMRPLVEGKIRSCFSMTEVDQPGSNPVMLDTTAVLQDGQWVINGHKWYTSSADGAEFAIVMAVTDPEAPPHLRASMIIAPTKTPGFNRVRNISVMGHSGSGWPSHAEILYQNCRVPGENLLGPRGHGFIIAQERLGPGRIHHCMRWIGICNRCLELMCQRALTRPVSPNQKLADMQIIQTWIAECAAEIRAAKLLILNCAWTIQKYGVKEARQDISLIKFYAAGVMQKVVDRALQVHGGLGMTDDTPIASFYRHERASRIYDGVDEVHKISVAKRIIKEAAAKVAS
ncbi:MAG: acyl-CoA dehydrogenase [Desulfarculus sp.]|jgi:alkylation response protein AidB-like acyl-CoA dehydrogenase|nr:MAG: acyl-CoA dehydrogenase [Desulfarculus sp.]